MCVSNVSSLNNDQLFTDEWLNRWEQLCLDHRANRLQNIGNIWNIGMTQLMRTTVLGTACQPYPKKWNRQRSHVPSKSYPFYILSIVCWEYKRTMKQSKVIQEILARFDDDVARLNTFNASKTGGESISLKQYGSSWVTINVLVQT